MFERINKLIIVGNGFDLAHGLKTTYQDFLDWYMLKAFNEFSVNNHYEDLLVEMSNGYSRLLMTSTPTPKTSTEVIKFINSNNIYKINYKSFFFSKILSLFNENNWVDIEIYYFKLLKSYFSNNSYTNKKDIVSKLNKDFDFLVEQLSEYIRIVNKSILNVPKLKAENSKNNFNNLFLTAANEIKILNFNYSETLNSHNYADDDDIIHIHGRVSEMDNNPIIFGYGDESDPSYQSIEDSGENMYLEHIKSFGYFKTNNYNKLLAYIDSSPYVVSILGHSCGLSDRVLLSEIFEHSNCQKIDIFYHQKNGSDNFKEITQEISRHFKPQNKNIMRRKIIDKNSKNIIPQNP